MTRRDLRKSPTPKWPLALAAAALLLATVPGAAAEPDASWSLEPRFVALAQDPGGYHFTSERATGLAQDRIEGRFDAASAILRHEVLATRPDAMTVRTELELVALREVRDTDGDGLAGPADATLQRIPVFGLPYTVHLEDAGEGQATVAYTLPAPPRSGPLPVPDQPGGRLTFTLHLADEPAAGVPPTAARADVTVEGFPFQEPGSLLVLDIAVSGPEPTASADGIATDLTAPILTRWGWTSSGPDGDGEAPPATVTLLDPGTVTQSTVLAHSGNAQATGLLASERRAGPTASPMVEATRDAVGDWRLVAAGLGATAAVLGAVTARRLRRP